MKTLVIVDFQYDFCNPNGTLYVPGAEEAEEAIVRHIREDGEISEVIFTLDWHPVHHCSFKQNGGQWPVHCLQYSQGASISQKIMNACISFNIPMRFITKGSWYWQEEYGAFPKVYNGDEFGNLDGDSYQFRSENVEVCGLALDYCVKETLRNLYTLGYKKKIIKNLSVFMDGTKAINPDSDEVKEFFKKHPEIKKI